MTDQAQTKTPAKAPHWSGDDLQTQLKDTTTPILVDFYAEWCGPCKLAAPIIDKLSGEYAGKVRIAKVDTDENNEAARQYGVMSIPTVVVFNMVDGEMKEVNRKIGFPGEMGYRQMLNKVSPEDAGMAKAA